MIFTKRLREGVRRGRITCSVRIWTHPHVKVGGRYPMDAFTEPKTVVYPAPRYRRPGAAG